MAVKIFKARSNERNGIISLTHWDGRIKVGDYDVSWSSSNTKYLKNDGSLVQPTYTEGDKTINLSASFSYSPKTFIYNFIKPYIGDSFYEKTFKISLPSADPSPEELLDMAISGLYMPSEVDYSIGLNETGMIDGLTITWTSSNEDIISNEGVVVLPSEDTVVTLRAVFKYQELSKAENYDVLVLSRLREVNSLDENYNDLTTSSRYSTIDTGLVTYKGALITENPEFDASSVDASDTNTADNVVKLRSNNENEASLETKLLKKAYDFSFNYRFSDSKGKNTYLDVYFNDSFVEKVELESSEDFKTYTHNFEGNDGIIKVIFVNDIQTNKSIIIDDLKVASELSTDDVSGEIIIPTSLNKSVMLPNSTSKGGIVTWKSSDTSVITDDGIVNNQVTEKATVTLTATLKYRSITTTFTYEVSVKVGKVKGDKLNIYFIDLGETDLGDCGESILITYNNIDILVDAGDQKESTYLGVKNAIMSYSSDQILDYVIATHPDSDHIGNMANVFKDFQVNNLIKFSGESFTTQKFKNLKAAYDSEPNCTVYDIYNDIINDNDETNDYIYLSSEIYIEFIDTKFYLDQETNGRSVVFLLNVYNTKVLFTGDADNLGSHSKLEESYMNEVGDIDILKVVHHGTANGSKEEYLRVLKPEVAIICNGNFLGNKHGHPHVETITRLYNCSSIKHVYAITGGGLHCEIVPSGAYKGTTTLEESLVDRNGTITLTIDGSGYKFSAKYTNENLIDLKDTTYYKNYLQAK